VEKSGYQSLGLKWTQNAVSHDIAAATYYDMETFNHMPLDFNGDSGGPWLLNSHKELIAPGVYAPGFNPGGGGVVTGNYIIGGRTGPSDSWTPPGPVSGLSLIASGTTAIARCEPTNPAFSLSQAIGEAREGMPTVIGTQSWRARTLKAREAGGEYLNYQFGWVPLVSDIRGFASAVKNSHKIVHSYKKQAAHKIKRSYHFPDVSGSQFWEGSFFMNPAHAFLSGNEFQYRTSELWFDGCFKYYLNMGSTILDKFDRYNSYANRILGIDLTPETLWNLAPWSWAADWFANTGDVIHNISALGRDGLVMQYGYIMSHQRLETHRHATVNDGYPWVPCSQTVIDDVKQRLPATPYGFGVDLNSLTAKQTAILVALGLSRT
jgi:hypothetical protein